MSEFALENALEIRVKIERQRHSFLVFSIIAGAFVYGFAWLGGWSNYQSVVLFVIVLMSLLLRHEILQHLRRMELRLLFAISPTLEPQVLARFLELKADKSAWKLWGNEE